MLFETRTAINQTSLERTLIEPLPTQRATHHHKRATEAGNGQNARQETIEVRGVGHGLKTADVDKAGVNRNKNKATGASHKDTRRSPCKRGVTTTTGSPQPRNQPAERSPPTTHRSNQQGIFVFGDRLFFFLDFFFFLPEIVEVRCGSFFPNQATDKLKYHGTPLW